MLQTGLPSFWSCPSPGIPKHKPIRFKTHIFGRLICFCLQVKKARQSILLRCVFIPLHFKIPNHNGGKVSFKCKYFQQAFDQQKRVKIQVLCSGGSKTIKAKGAVNWYLQIVWCYKNQCYMQTSRTASFNISILTAPALSSCQQQMQGVSYKVGGSYFSLLLSDQ